MQKNRDIQKVPWALSWQMYRLEYVMLKTSQQYSGCSKSTVKILEKLSTIC